MTNYNRHHIFTSNWSRHNGDRLFRNHKGLQVEMDIDEHNELHTALGNMAVEYDGKYGQIPGSNHHIRRRLLPYQELLVPEDYEKNIAVVRIAMGRISLSDIPEYSQRKAQILEEAMMIQEEFLI